MDFTRHFRSSFLKLALAFITLISIGTVVTHQTQAAVDLCASPTTITGGGSFSISTSGTCFKYVDSSFVHGAILSVMKDASSASDTLAWYGGLDQNATSCASQTSTISGNGGQLNNFTVGKDSSNAMYLSVTGSATNTITLSIQNWLNGSGCSIAPTPRGSSPTNTPGTAPSNTPVPPTKTNTPPPTTGPSPTTGPTKTFTLIPTNGPTKTNTATFVPPTVTKLPPTATTRPAGGRQMEKLNRGLVRVNESNGNYVSWRLLGTDPSSVSFNVYRNGTKLTSSPITNSTNYFDGGGNSSNTYTVRPVLNGVEQADSEQSFNVSSNGYYDLPIQPPAGGTTPDGVAYTYTANDVSVGDVDGDGQYEFILKWDPTNSKDNSQSGYTGDVFVDCYKLNGQRLWRIDLGRNIRAGQHYTQFQVYDYDGDGKAEIAMKTGDGTIDGTGKVIGNASADYRNSSGYVLSGPEYLTIFNGLTGAAMQTINYDPPRGTVSDWGDSYGNRVDRFLAGTAYLDGVHPSLIVTRGYYTRTVIVAYDWRNGALTERWKFDSNVSGSQYTDEGDHQLSIADVDGDGKDEVIFGSMAIDDNGAPLWNTNFHHGDAMHVFQPDPNHAGLYEWHVDENTDMPAAWLVDTRTGQTVWKNATCTCDNGRGMADYIWAGSSGVVMWSSGVSGLFDENGNNVGRKPGSDNFAIWWQDDLVRDLLDATHIDRYGTSSDTRIMTASGVHSNNGTKSVPSLSADIFGDWREEVIWPTTSDTALRIYFTTYVTSTRLFTLMHDSQYRVAIAWQNTAYNQPPHPSFFIGNGMHMPAQPNIYTP